MCISIYFISIYAYRSNIRWFYDNSYHCATRCSSVLWFARQKVNKTAWPPPQKIITPHLTNIAGEVDTVVRFY